MINKKLIIVLLAVSVLIILFTNNNYFIYKYNILHITKIDNKVEKSEISNEKYYYQTITGVLRNGKNKNHKYAFENMALESGVFDEKYHVGEDLFVELSNDSEHVVGIAGVKRDKYVVPLILIFTLLLIILAGKKGVFILFSFIINIIFTILAVLFYKSEVFKIGILPIFMIVAILFIFLSLFITNGKSKKTWAAIISSVVSLFLSFGLCFLIIKIYDSNIPYWTMDYIETIQEYKNFFLVSVLLSGLGAIMDISITIASSLNELIEKNPKISLKSLAKSGREISKDIAGTMCNIMLFTCFTSIIPMMVLATRNYMSLFNALKHYGELEFILVLTSCISIVLSIHISLYVSTFLLTRKEDKK